VNSPHPLPDAGDRERTLAWVDTELAGLWSGPLAGSARFRGGAGAAAAALATFDVAGYASRRNEVAPVARRGASGLSPWIRHGLLTLPEVWHAVADGPRRDVTKFRDELRWAEYARHVYARLGPALGEDLRASRSASAARDRGDATGGPWTDDPWPRHMACMDLAVGELETDGWVVNQARMWLASQWSVRAGRAWREGEDRFFRHLLDGSRAANRLGWQWTVGTGTGRPYGFSRWQVEKRAPGTCASCRHASDCPIGHRPTADDPVSVEADRRLYTDPDPETTAGPRTAHRAPGPADPAGGPGGAGGAGGAEAVWLTAESLGDTDPALAARPDLPAVFVFDRALLGRLQLSAKRLVFLVESLADLAARRPVEVAVGDPVAVLAGRRLATTFAPVPGWRRRADRLDLAEIHPWPWLVRPDGGSLSSFSAWDRRTGLRP
jgi:deoxyribodipyrimidine photo-lyase